MSATRNVIEIKLENTFSESEWRAISVFKKKGLELQKIDLISSGNSNISCQIKYNRETGTTLSVNLPSENQLKELFLAFRFFYMKNEPSHFYRVINIIKKAARDERVNQIMDTLKQQYSGALQKKYVFSAKLNDTELSLEYLLDLWFNAHYFHSDEDKEKSLNKLNELLSTDYSKFLLVNSVLEGVKAVIQLYRSLQYLEPVENAT